MNEVIELLKELKFNIASRGFMYWIYAIETRNKDKNVDIQEIYKYLAEKEGTTTQNIEGSMKYARKNSDRMIKNYFNYSGSLTNNTVLNLISLEGD